MEIGINPYHMQQQQAYFEISGMNPDHIFKKKKRADNNDASTVTMYYQLIPPSICNYKIQLEN